MREGRRGGDEGEEGKRKGRDDRMIGKEEERKG